MAFAQSLLSWIPLVNFKSDQEGFSPVEGIEPYGAVETPPVPEPPREVATQIKMADELEDRGWEVYPPSSGAVHSYLKKVWNRQFFEALNKIDSPIWDASAVKEHVSEVAEDNNELLQWHSNQLSKIIIVINIIWLISVAATWMLESALFEKIVPYGGLTVFFLVITSFSYILYLLPKKMVLQGINPTSFSEGTPTHVKDKAKLVQNSAPNVNTIVYKVQGTPWRFITASCGDPDTEVCIANWKKPGSD